MTNLEKQISKIYHGAKVTNIEIDYEFNCITATINGITSIDCGWLEDYEA